MMMKSRLSRFARPRGRHRAAIPWLLLLLAGVVHAERADYAIIGSLDRLTLLNRYEQPITTRERETFVPYAPVRIDERDLILGDMITRALSFDYHGHTYYALHDDKGGRADNKFKRILTNCTPLNDTVTTAKAVRFTPSPPGHGATKLSKGVRVARIFQSGNRCYVLRLNKQPMYGWAPAGTQWHATSAADIDENGEMPLELRKRLLGRIEQVNETYRHFFTHFNAFTGNHKSVPAWQPAAQSANELTWTLSKPYGEDARLARSTRSLIQDLEGLLLGKPYTVSYTNGILAIVARGAASTARTGR